MTTAYESLKMKLRAEPNTWLITGVAGFIGSNLLETLLKLNQRVVGLDNFSTCYQRNFDEVESALSAIQLANFRFIEGDIRNLADRHKVCQSVDYVLHQATQGSVPRSIADPISTNANNIDDFLKILVAARDASVQRFVYTASSSIYGDHPDLPKEEANIGKPLSPCAVTKLLNELYADVFARIMILKRFVCVILTFLANDKTRMEPKLWLFQNGRQPYFKGMKLLSMVTAKAVEIFLYRQCSSSKLVDSNNSKSCSCESGL